MSESTFFDNIRSKLTNKPLTIIVFGASGHLAKTKTYPSLFDCFTSNCLPSNFNCIGYGRSALNKQDFHNRISLKLPKNNTKTNQFLNHCSYIQGKSYNDPLSLKKLSNYIIKLENNINTNRLYYLAVPPNVFVDICQGIKLHMNNENNNGWTRIIIEKPFGLDLNSFNIMNNNISKYWSESIIYRVDHYLAKEMIENIICLRFSNILFNNILFSNKYIKYIKISMKEIIDVDGRGGYYENNGVIRDVLQNHLLQVLSLITMDNPSSLKADDIRYEKAKVLKYIKPINDKNTIIGQYISNGKLPGYREDKTVSNTSNQSTYCNTILHINNSRWNGVPFICECGKALNKNCVDIKIVFKNSDIKYLFPNISNNEIILKVQPTPLIIYKTNIKKPGYATLNETINISLKIDYNKKFSDVKMPNAYTRLIMDCLNGDQSLFVRSDELREAWRIVTPYLEEIERKNARPELYVRGSNGPKSVKDMNEKFINNVKYLAKL